MSPAEWYARQRARQALGEAQRRRSAGEVDAAIAAFERAAALDRALRRETLHAAADLLIEAKRPADAIPRLQALVKLDKSDVESWRRLARALVQTGEPNAAIKAWRRVEERAERDLEAAQALAELLPKGSRESIGPLRVVAEAASGSDRPWRRLAQALRDQGDGPAETEVWRRVLELAPGDLMAHDRLAALLEAEGRLAEAEVHLKAAAEADPPRIKVWKRYARTLETMGRGDEAFRAWRRVLEIDPTDRNAHERMAALLAAQGFNARALVHLRALAEGVGDRAAWRRLAESLTALARTDEAADAWRKVLEVDPGEHEAHLALVGLLADDPAAAVPHWRAAVAATPKKPELWRGLARTLAAIGELAEAAEAWKQVLKFDANDLEAHGRLVDLLGTKGKTLPHLQVLAERGPDPAAARRALARVFEKLGDTAGAVAAWKSLLELEAGDLQAHGKLVELQGETEDSVPHLRVLAAGGPDPAAARRRLARLLEKLGDAPGAVAAWKSLLKLDEGDLEAHAALVDLIGDRKSGALPHLKILAERDADPLGASLRLARLQDKLGDLQGAIAAWRHLQALSPDDPTPHERLTDLLTTSGDVAAAEVHLRWLAAHGLDGLRGYRRLAQSLRDRGDVEGEIALWRRYQADRPNEIAPHEQLVTLLDGQGRKAEAAEHLRALALLQAGQVKPWKRVAKAFEELGETASALEAWAQVLAADAEDPHARDEMARLLDAQSRSAEAAGYLLEAARRDPQNLRRWRRLASRFQDAADESAEIDTRRHLLALDPQDVQAHERLGTLLEARGDKAAAALHVRALAEADPERSKHWRRLAGLLDEAGDAPGALEAWERVSTLEPSELFARDRRAQLLIDLGRPAEAAAHLQVLAGADPGKSKSWRRLAQTLADAGQAEAELSAWRHLLVVEPDDLQAHERLAMLLTDAGREAEALEHLQAAVSLAPENARAWRRYARALNRSDASLGELEVWRRTVALAGHAELQNQLVRLGETQQRNQDLKLELQGVGAELKRERGATLHVQGRLDREERAHRATQGLLKDELAERRRLTAELQDSTQRQRQAEAEEASHLIAGRLIGLLEPLAGADVLTAAQADEAGAYAEECLRIAATDGALVVATEADARLSGVDLAAPGELAARLRGKASRLVVLADRGASARDQVRAELAGRRGVAVIDLDDLVVRRAAGLENLKAHVEPVSEDVWPARPLMIVSSDNQLRQAVAEGVRTATGVAFAPLFPLALASRVQARELDLDDWLAAAWSAHGRPRAFGFQFDAETLALFAREIRAGRAQVMARVFRRATALHLAWSDKALHAAADHFARSGMDTAADFDAGDAQIEVKTYKRLVARDMLLESALEQLGKFKPATTKAYRELFDKRTLGRFCRDMNLSVGVTGFAQVDERAVGFMPSPELIRAGGLIAEAVQSLTAVREPEAPPQGMVQYGLGRSLEALGRHAEALEAYREASVRAPTYFPARAAAARYLELAGQPAQAEALLRQALGNGTPDQDVQEGLLDFYQRNASPKGVAAVARLMRRRGQIRPAIAAPALVELGRWCAAEPLLETISARTLGQDNFLNDFIGLPRLAQDLPMLEADARGGDGAAQLRLAEALRRLGRLADALPWYRKALSDAGALEAEVGEAAAFRPRFLMVGPPRTGTTLLRRLFDLHPQIATPSGELFFFSNRTGQRAGSNRQRAPLSWYLDAFKAAAERKPEARLIGEKTPHYFSTSDDQMAFASVLLPGVKIIATLRDPVVRAWSEIKVQRRATEAEIVAALSQGGRPNWLTEILDAGRYTRHLERWLKHVRPEQLLLVDCDALEHQVAEEAGRIFRWLGVKDLPRRQVTALQQGWNNRTESFSPSAPVEAMLRRSYEGEAFTAADVGRALGLGQDGPAAAPRPQRRRPVAK